MTQRRTRQPGFTLAELMVALGILAVGLSMIAAAFPAGLVENKESIQDTMTTIIGENASSYCRVRLRHPVLDARFNPGGSHVTGLLDISDLFQLAERAYPMPLSSGASAGEYTLQIGVPYYRPADWINVGGTQYPAARYGWLVAACQPTAHVNDYTVFIIPYRKLAANDHPGSAASPAQAAEVYLKGATVTGSKLNQPDTTGWHVGAPVIYGDSSKPEKIGAYTTVKDSTGLTNVPVFPNGAVMTVASTRAGPSLAIGCFPARMSLQP